MLDEKIIKKISSSDYLPMLVEASRAINSTLDLNNVLHSILENVAKVTRSEGSSILLKDEVSGDLYFKCCYGKKNIADLDIKIDLNKSSVAGWVVKNGRPVIISDPYNDDRFFKGVDDISGMKTRNIMGAPLKKGKKVFGVLEVINRINNGDYEEEDIDILVVLANLATAAIENARLYEALKLENEGLKQEYVIENPIIGVSAPIKRVLGLIDKVAQGSSTVLIQGESGTGKELVAERIHQLSPRRDKPLIKVNCAAIPETLIESELFGHERGAFTGAIARKLGKFELASKGTIFLDEIGELSLGMQIKLLRVLQEKTFERVGGTSTIRVDVRLIAATNKDLERAIWKGEFREDLYYRLNVIPINVPPLRERRQDIPHLANFFLKRYAGEMLKDLKGFSKEAMNVLKEYDWTGNIRELANIVERIAVISSNKVIQLEDIPNEIRDEKVGGQKSLWDVEKTLIINALNECKWNISATARKLGISRSILRYRLKKYDIEKESI